MSASAAEIDRLCNEHDILIIQSIGNLRPSHPRRKPELLNYCHPENPIPRTSVKNAVTSPTPPKAFKP
jgi:hypothetical protein